jgi:hypothetical protein
LLKPPPFLWGGPYFLRAVLLVIFGVPKWYRVDTLDPY